MGEISRRSDKERNTRRRHPDLKQTVCPPKPRSGSRESESLLNPAVVRDLGQYYR